MSRPIVVDTNVGVVANGRSPQAGIDCVAACVDELDKVRKSCTVLVDSGGLIFEEYSRHFAYRGQPGVGDAFFKWLWDNQGNSRHCRKVAITPRSGASEDFVEFPATPALSSFDPSDRKFVAVALASKTRPPILNAVDSDWWHHRAALETHGVQIVFLCLSEMQV